MNYNYGQRYILLAKALAAADQHYRIRIIRLSKEGGWESACPTTDIDDEVAHEMRVKDCDEWLIHVRSYWSL